MISAFSPLDIVILHFKGIFRKFAVLKTALTTGISRSHKVSRHGVTAMELSI